MTKTTDKPKKHPEVVACYRHRDVDGLILEHADGSCCTIQSGAFNAYSDRQRIERTVINDGSWRCTKLPLSTIPSSARAPVRGRPLPMPLSENTTARGMNKRREQRGQPLMSDWLDEHKAKAEQE